MAGILVVGDDEFDEIRKVGLLPQLLCGTHLVFKQHQVELDNHRSSVRAVL
jgi:hypothetical protein